MIGALLQELRGLLDHVVALDVFLADVEKTDGRALDALDRRGERAAHHRELDELRRRAVDVGAKVERSGDALARRQLRCDRGTVDTGQRLQHEARDRHERAGVAGRHARLRRRRP